jgi:hypothetical protein
VTVSKILIMVMLPDGSVEARFDDPPEQARFSTVEPEVVLGHMRGFMRQAIETNLLRDTGGVAIVVRDESHSNATPYSSIRVAGPPPRLPTKDGRPRQKPRSAPDVRTPWRKR